MLSHSSNLMSKSLGSEMLLILFTISSKSVYHSILVYCRRFLYTVILLLNSKHPVLTLDMQDSLGKGKTCKQVFSDIHQFGRFSDFFKPVISFTPYLNYSPYAFNPTDGFKPYHFFLTLYKWSVMITH